MVDWNRPEMHDAAGRFRPISFIAKQNTQILLCFIILCLFFQMLVSFKIDPIPLWFADASAKFIGHILRFVGSVYSEILQHGYVQQAKTYSAFIAGAVICCSLIPVRSFRAFFRETDPVGLPSWGDALVLVVGVGGALPRYSVFDDTGRGEFDLYGMFYFYHGIVVLCGFLALTDIALIAVVLARRYVRIKGSQNDTK